MLMHEVIQEEEKRETIVDAHVLALYSHPHIYLQTLAVIYSILPREGSFNRNNQTLMQ